MVLWIVAALIVAYAAWTFNRLVRLRARARAAWSDIDVQLERRADLVPALVATVKGYAKHEASTLEEVVAARTPESVAARGAQEGKLEDAVHRIFALAEAYPDLKASASFRDLHTSLVEIEDTLQHARRYYNAVVRDLNTLVSSVPSNVVAGLCGFRPHEYFQLDSDDERAAPAVDLGEDA
jgi:LemA protein